MNNIHSTDERTLGEQIRLVIEQLPANTVSLGEILELVGREGMLLLVAFLTLVFMVPVSIPGVSTIFGAAILLIGISRIFGRTLWLPKRFKERALPADKLRHALEKGLVWIPRLEKVSRPHRMAWLTQGRMMNIINDGALILGAVLLMAPFGFIPFSNTVPGIALLFLAVGLIQRDGAAVLLGHLANVASIVYFGVLIGGGGMMIQNMLQNQA
ncbi:MAG: exopolysaccharide biosynthesis protein [Gammaproteobacteria bacterium]|nr:exopolysaccharide biosynthesis protein [Gammaproteobacteria bacterium]MBU0850337.1 exopolysaccharide biosynthesis protein [Gammaproteobacteria bacterium]MBU1267446.1 exopolysaccharide biosynthesis protein [Gammaproteobacteria bacterium]MBU1529100.1 exopolysaccharide biosynthesis protein [Gammaproteobacteria bacterium]MBU1781674.1 exopolysaccharide biosynthesis protein [Gammaproteobacteria bacterium]